jgi:hypothetical protein
VASPETGVRVLEVHIEALSSSANFLRLEGCALWFHYAYFIVMLVHAKDTFLFLATRMIVLGK